MTVVVKAGSYIFAAPSQVLTDAAGSSNPSDILASLEKSLNGRMPTNLGDTSTMTVTKETWSFKEYRTATRSMLAGLVNSLSNVFNGFRMASTVPKNPLRPAGYGWDRVEYLPEELKVMSPNISRGYFRFHPETGETKADFFQSDQLTRVCFSSDEGTEAGLTKVFQEKHVAFLNGRGFGTWHPHILGMFNIKCQCLVLTHHGH